MPTVYPIVPGHEIVGRVAKVGSAVTKCKPGDLAAAGCLVDSDRTCPRCKAGLENFCPNLTLTLNSPDKRLGGVTYAQPARPRRQPHPGRRSREAPGCLGIRLIMGRRSLSGSNIGGIPETQETLDFCGAHNIAADVEADGRRQARNDLSRVPGSRSAIPHIIRT